MLSSQKRALTEAAVAEKTSLEGIRLVVIATCEALALWQLLAENQLHILSAGMRRPNWLYFCPRRNKIPSRTIVLKAWVSSVVCRLSCVVSCVVSNLKDGIFSKRFELEG